MKHRKSIIMSLLAVIIVGFLLPIHTAKAEFLPLQSNYFYDYDSTATASGTWGANLFSGNDKNKQFISVLPKDSQWRIYGYTLRADGIYYWAGGDQWIQGDQAQVSVDNESDAILNIIAKLHNDSGLVSWLAVHYTPTTYTNDTTNGYWGADYWVVRDMTGSASFKHQYVVYPDGGTYQIDLNWPFNTIK